VAPIPKKSGLEDGDAGRPTILPPEQTSAVADYAIAQFHSMQPASCNRLVWFVRSEFHIDILPETLQTILLRDPRLTLHHFKARIAAIEVQRHDGMQMKLTISQNLLSRFGFNH
jgi:hypothetical protein